MNSVLQFAFAESENLIVIGICLMLSAFFSSAETAITSLGTLKAKHLVDQNTKNSKYLKLWLDHPGRVIATILLFNNVVNILASSVTTHVTYKYVENGAIGIATGVMTFLVLVFGEVVPKSFAKTHAEALGLFSIRVIVGFYYVGYPLILLLASFSDVVVRIVSGSTKQNPLITEEELEFMVSEGEKAGVIEDLKKEIIAGAFDFDETKVREIMTPRTDIKAVELETELQEVLNLIVETGHSRVPVYRDQIDHIVGLVLAKDLLTHSDGGIFDSKLPVKNYMRDCLFAPESKSIMGVFKDLKRTKSHMAVIIDEYGGTAGIVTMEDILEEIVGEIQDEFDTEEAKILEVDKDLYDVSGSLNIEEFLDHFELNDEHVPGGTKELEIDTVSGLITQLVGQLPQRGQSVDLGKVTMVVQEVKNRRIDQVRVRINPASSDQESAESEVEPASRGE